MAWLNLPNMRWLIERKVDAYAHAVSGLLELEPDPESILQTTTVRPPMLTGADPIDSATKAFHRLAASLG